MAVLLKAKNFIDFLINTKSDLAYFLFSFFSDFYPGDFYTKFIIYGLQEGLGLGVGSYKPRNMDQYMLE